MRMLHGYVAIEPDKPPEKSAGGLLLAEQIKTYPPTGTVKHVADSITDIKPGARVAYKVYASVDIEENLAIVPYESVCAVL